MSILRTHIERQHLLMLLVGLCLCLLTACETQGQQPVSQAIEVTAPEATSTAIYPTPEFPYGSDIDRAKQDGETKVAANRATRVAILTLTPRVTPQHEPIYLESPVPTATWATGYFGGLDNVSPARPEYVSCWTGYFQDTKP